MVAMNRKKDKVPGIKESAGLLSFEYVFRQVGFIVLMAIIVAAIAGLFSKGIISDSQKTNSAQSLTVSYERFGRRETEFPVQMTFPVKTAGEYVLSLTSEASDAYEPGSVWPQPDRMFSRGNTFYFVYQDLKVSEKFTVLLYLTPSQAGRLDNVIRLNHEPDVRFWQFIYP